MVVAVTCTVSSPTVTFHLGNEESPSFYYDCLMVGTTQYTLDEFRARLQKMTDAELIRYGKSARFMSKPENGKADPVYVAQLEECRAEWRRRHPK